MEKSEGVSRRIPPQDLPPEENCGTFKGTARLNDTDKEDALCPVPQKRPEV